MTSLKQKVSKATFWNLGSSAINGFLRFASTAVVARILSPEDFGVFGLAMIVQGVVLLFGNFGFGPALIYKKDADEEHYSTFFWTNVFTGLLLTGITIGLAPLAAMFFRNHLVQPVLMVVAINFLINGIPAIYRTRLTKDLKFKEISLTEFYSTIAHVFVLTGSAYLGCGVWSIVFALIFSNLIRIPIYMFYEKWHPKFTFSTRKLKEMFGYGRNLFAEQILNYLSKNVDYFIVGRILGAKQLGLYQFAYNVPHLPYIHFAQRVTSILFPMLSKVQDDATSFSRGYLKAISFVNLVTFPVIGFLFVATREFVLTVYGNQWESIIVPLKILCLTAAIRCIETFSGSVFNSQGRPDIGLKFNAIKLPIVLLALIIGAYYHQVIGLATAMSIVVTISFLFSTILVKRFINTLTYKEIFNELKLGIYPTILMIAILWLIQMTPMRQLSLPIQLSCEAIIGTLCYIGFGLLFYREKWLELIGFIKLVKS